MRNLGLIAALFIALPLAAQAPTPPPQSQKPAKPTLEKPDEAPVDTPTPATATPKKPAPVKKPAISETEGKVVEEIVARVNNEVITRSEFEHSKAAAEEKVEREIRAAVAANPDDIAALIIEPIQGEGGDNHFRPELFRRLRALADELEFLLIFDEVQTGVGLTGSMWAWQQMEVEPDLFVFGKKTQVCGFAANHRVDDVPDNVFKVSSRINSTWGGNLVDMIRCGRYLEIIAEEKLIENARVVGDYLQSRLRELATEFPAVMTNVRGRGLFTAFDLPDKGTRDRTLAACLDNGLMGLASGAHAIRFRPHLILSKDEAEEGVRKLRRAIVAVRP